MISRNRSELLMLLAAAYERGGKNELADRQYADALKVIQRRIPMSPFDMSRFCSAGAMRSRRRHSDGGCRTAIRAISRSCRRWRSSGLSRQNWSGALADRRHHRTRRRGARAGRPNSRCGARGPEQDRRKHRGAGGCAQSGAGCTSAGSCACLGLCKQGKADKAVALLQEMSKKFPDKCPASGVSWTNQASAEKER